MELKFTYLKNGLWVYLDNKQILGFNGVIDYEIKGNPRDFLLMKKGERVRVSVKMELSGHVSFEFLGTSVRIRVKTTKTSIITTYSKEFIFSEDTCVHVF